MSSSIFKKLRIGTRRSALARAQTLWVQTLLEASGVPTEVIEITSRGDQDRTTPLYAMENHTPGLFTKQLEQALLENQIDLAVHSMKDLPTQSDDTLGVVAIPAREDPHDAIVVHPSAYDEDAAFGVKSRARIGTSSLRREALLHEEDPSLDVVSLRGNVPTRVAAVQKGEVQAAVIAKAGLLRLGLLSSAPGSDDHVLGLPCVTLPIYRFVPAPAQGALALQMRRGDPFFAPVAALDSGIVRRAVTIERDVLHRLHGGCTVPLGVFCLPLEGRSVSVRAYLGECAQTAPGVRQWVKHHRFDISGDEDEILVAKTVAHLTGVARIRP